MTNDGLGRVMGYDADNRLTSVARTVAAATTTSTLSYDPAGQLSQLAVTAGATTNFLYDGAQAIAEYDGSNALLRRYVPGAGVDETLVWYEGSGVSDRRWLLTDARGSVIAIANASGVVTARNKYDDYGAPDAGNVGRFQYTGQMWLAEAGLYHYKARAYHPELGRFLQTDPIGYGDGMNMYAYVGNDPVNAVDSSGLIDEIVVQGVNHGYPTGGGFSFGGGGGGGGSFAGGEPIDEIFVYGTRRTKPDYRPNGKISVDLSSTNAQQQGQNSCNVLQNFAGALALGFELSSNTLNGLSDLAYIAGLAGATPSSAAGFALDVASAALDLVSYAFDLAAGNSIGDRLGVSAIKLIPGSTVVRAALRSTELEGRIAEGVIDVLAPETQRRCGI